MAGEAGDHASEDQEHKSGNQADRRGDDAGDLAGRKDVNALDDHRFLPMPAGYRRSRSEEHTSELQSLMRISYAVFCLKKKKPHTPNTRTLNIYTVRNTTL